MHFAGEYTKGRLEGCDISGSKSYNVTFSGGADPILVASCIHDGVCGVRIMNSETKGRVERCEISRHKLEGARVDDGADPLILASRIHDNESYGVVFHGAGTQGKLERAVVFGNAGVGGLQCGVGVLAGAGPQILSTRIYGNGGVANVLFSGEGTTGLLSSCAVSGGAAAGVVIESGASPFVKSNAVYLNKQVRFLTCESRVPFSVKAPSSSPRSSPSRSTGKFHGEEEVPQAESPSKKANSFRNSVAGFRRAFPCCMECF